MLRYAKYIKYISIGKYIILFDKKYISKAAINLGITNIVFTYQIIINVFITKILQTNVSHNASFPV